MQSKAVSDHRVERLHALADRLSQCLREAEAIRARCTKAHDANAWPDLRSVSRSRRSGLARGMTNLPSLKVKMLAYAGTLSLAKLDVI